MPRNLQSLLIVGVPKGFTTETYRIALVACSLRNSPAPQGEVLNWDTWPIRPFLPSYNHSEEGYALCRPILQYFQRGHVIKDVVQPFYVLRFLQENAHTYKVLYVERNPHDVEMCQRLVNWYAGPGDYDFHPVQQLYSSQFTTVRCEEILYNTSSFFKALTTLGYRVSPFNYITPAFVARREATIKKIKDIAESFPTK